jgi:hypothetical protein
MGGAGMRKFIDWLISAVLAAAVVAFMVGAFYVIANEWVCR